MPALRQREGEARGELKDLFLACLFLCLGFDLFGVFRGTRYGEESGGLNNEVWLTLNSVSVAVGEPLPLPLGVSDILGVTGGGGRLFCVYPASPKIFLLCGGGGVYSCWLNPTAERGGTLISSCPLYIAARFLFISARLRSEPSLM